MIALRKVNPDNKTTFTVVVLDGQLAPSCGYIYIYICVCVYNIYIYYNETVLIIIDIF